MTTLTERVARAIGAVIDASGQTAGDEALAEAAIREVLAALREPSDWWASAPPVGVTLGQWRQLLDAFERAHGIDPPSTGDQP